MYVLENIRLSTESLWLPTCKKTRLPKHNARKWIKHIAFLKQEGPKIFLFLTCTFYFLIANFVDWSSGTNLTKYHLLIYWRDYSLLILQ